MTLKELIGTKWHIVCSPNAQLKPKDILLGKNGELTYDGSSYGHLWNFDNGTIRLSLNNGYAICTGTINNNIFNGNAKNKVGTEWTFTASLISVKRNTNSKIHEHGISAQSRKRKNWAEFNRVLTENNISTLYHFTAKENIQSIKEHGALYSWQYSETNHIVIPQAGGDGLSRSLDRRHGVQNYVRLSFTRNHPMMYLLQTRGRLGNTVVLEIDPEVVFWKDTKFANKNATRNDVNIGSTLEDFNRIRFNIVKQQNHFDLAEEDKPFYQAEVLVLEKIPIEFITNISDL